MAKEDLKITAGIDVSALRKQVETAFRDIPLSISASTINAAKKDIESRLVPKLRLDTTDLGKGLSQRISDAIGSVKIKFDFNDKGLNSLRSEAEKNLKGLRIELSKQDVDRIKSQISSASIVSLNFNPADAALLRKRAEDFFNKSPIKIRATIDAPNKGEIRSAISGGGKSSNRNRSSGGSSGGVGGGNISSSGSGEPEDQFAKSVTTNNKILVDNGSALNTVNRQMNEYEKATTRASTITNTFAERVGFTTGRLAAYLIPATAIFQLASAFSTAVVSIKDINEQVNKLTQILDGNAERANKISSDVLKTAERYGQSGIELLKVTNTLAQAGDQFLGSGDNVDRLEGVIRTLSKTKLAATFGDIEHTAEGAVAAINQFNLSGSELGKVLDIANQLSKKFAFESENLFDAVRSGGGAFALAGGDIKQFAATVSAARSITRLPSNAIGSAINTISQRALRPETISFEEQLTRGVGGIRDANGNLLTLVDRWKQVAKATQNYTDEQLEPVIEKLAELRQGKVLIPLLRDLQKGSDSTFLKNLQELEKAPGSLSRDATTGLDRIDVQLASIGARFEQVFGKLANDKGIKELVKEFSILAKSIAGVLEELIPIIPVLTRLGAVNLIGKVVTGIPGYLRGLSKVNRELSGDNPNSLLNLVDAERPKTILELATDYQKKNKFRQLFPAAAFIRKVTPQSETNIQKLDKLFSQQESAFLNNTGVGSNVEQIDRLNATRIALRSAIQNKSGIQVIATPKESITRANKISSLETNLDRLTEVSRKQTGIGFRNDLASPRNIGASFAENLAASPGLLGKALEKDLPKLDSLPEVRNKLIVQARANILGDLVAGIRTTPGQPFNLYHAIFKAKPAVDSLKLSDQGFFNRVSEPQKFDIRKSVFDRLGLAVSPQSLIQSASGADIYVAQRKTLYDAIRSYSNQLKQEGLDQSQIQSSVKIYASNIKTALGEQLKLTETQSKVRSDLEDTRRPVIEYNRNLKVTTRALSGAVLAGTNIPVAGQGSASIQTPGAFSKLLTGGGSLAGRFGRGIGNVATSDSFASVVPQVLAFGSALLFDSLAQSASERIRPLTDSSGRLAPNFIDLTNTNRKQVQRQGALTGAGIGATIGGVAGGPIGGAIAGSTFGPVGTLIGAITGLILGAGTGAVIGGEAAKKKSQDLGLSELFSAGSQAKDTREFARTLFASSKFIEKDKGIDALKNPDVFSKALRGVFKTEGGAANLDKIRDLANKELINLFNSGELNGVKDSDTGALVQASLSQRLAGSVQEEAAFNNQPISNRKALSIASQDIATGFRKLNGTTGELNNELARTKEKLRTNADKDNLLFKSVLANNSSSLTGFASEFKFGTSNSNRSLATANNVRAFNQSLNEQLSDAFLGRNGNGFSVPEEFADLLTQTLNQQIRELPDNLAKPNNIRDVLKGNSGGLLDNKTLDILSDTAFAQRQIENASKRGLGALSGKTFIKEEENVPGQAVSRILDEFLNENLLKNLKTSEVKNELTTRFATLKKDVRENPEIVGEDPIKFAANFLKDFGDLSIVTDRFKTILADVNNELRKSEALFEKRREVEQHQVQLEGQILSTQLERIRLSSSLGATTDDIVGALNKIIDSTTPTNGLRSAGQSVLNSPLKGSSFNLFSSDARGQAHAIAAGIEAKKDAQANFSNELQRTTQHVSALRAKFEELTHQTDQLINQNRGFGVTPLDQRFELQANTQIFRSLTDNLFEGKLGQARSVQEAFRTLSPEEIKQAASQFSGIGGTEPFILGSQAAEKLGKRFVPGAPPGVTFGARAEIAQTLAGLNFQDENGANLKQLTDGEKDRQNTFERIKDLEDVQVFYLRSINDTLREGFGLRDRPIPPSPPIFSTGAAQRSQGSNLVDKNGFQNSDVIQSIATLQETVGRLASANDGESGDKIITVLEKLTNAIAGARNTTDITASLNITGFDGVGKDVAVSAIVVSVIEKLADQLGATPQEQDLKEKLKASVRQLTGK